MNIDKIFETYGNIEKNIHISWKNKNVIDCDFDIIKYGIRNLRDLNPEYNFIINDDNDIEEYIKQNIDQHDYDLIKHKHIVEKTDLWRLLKIYNEGGIYCDIDRFCNIPFREIIKPNVKCILPMHFDIDFSQDIMISCSKNIIHKRAIELNLEGRRSGCTNILILGPCTYYFAVTEFLLGLGNGMYDRYPNHEQLTNLRKIINDSIYLDTYRETPMFDTLIYRGDNNLNNDKLLMYNYQNVKHWSA